MNLSVAILSVHTCPLAALGGKQTGGMNVYVRQTARELGLMGVRVDVFTRSQNATIPRIVELGPGARVIHLPAGPEAPMPREALHAHLDEFAAGRRRSRGAGDPLRPDPLALLALRRGGPAAAGALGRAPRAHVPHARPSQERGGRDSRRAGARAPHRRGDPHRRGGRPHRGRQRGGAGAPRLVLRRAQRAGRGDPVRRGHRAVPADGPRQGPRSPRAAPDPLLLYVGRLTPIKGLDTLLEAMVAIPGPADLLVVGGSTTSPTTATPPRCGRR